MNKDKFKKKKKFATFFKQQRGKTGEEETEWSFCIAYCLPRPFFFQLLKLRSHLPYKASQKPNQGFEIELSEICPNGKVGVSKREVFYCILGVVLSYREFLLKHSFIFIAFEISCKKFFPLPFWFFWLALQLN